MIVVKHTNTLTHAHTYLLIWSRFKQYDLFMALFMLVALSESETFNFDGQSFYGTVVKDIMEFEMVFNEYTSIT